MKSHINDIFRVTNSRYDFWYVYYLSDSQNKFIHSGEIRDTQKNLLNPLVKANDPQDLKTTVFF